MIPLNEEELNVSSIEKEQEQYGAYLKTYMSGENTIQNFMKKFDKWLWEHRCRLEAMYSEDPTPDKPDFLKWARNRYCLWAYHRYKDALTNQIDKLVT